MIEWMLSCGLGFAVVEYDCGVPRDSYNTIARTLPLSQTGFFATSTKIFFVGAIKTVKKNGWLYLKN